MKKNLVLFSLLIFGICLSAMAKKVDIKDAQRAGINFYYEKINAIQATPYQSIKITSEFTENAGNEPAYYIFNINDGKGFIYVAADDAVVPILGYSFEGSYSPDNHAVTFVSWMKHYADEIEYVRNQNYQADLELTSSWNHYLTTNVNDLVTDRSTLDVAPLISSLWNQDFPYNALCPEDPAATGSFQGRVPVGCVATAMAQIMYYWRYPSVGVGNHCIFPQPSYGPQCANFGATTYEWNGMANSSSKECYPAALISYHCGIAVNMDYAPDGSGAQVSAIPAALKNYFKYSTTAQYIQKANYPVAADWENLLKTDLNAGRPIEYAGYGPSGGHAWVCDGYQGTNYFHFNWGWGGSDNGYFYLNNLNPGGSTFTNSQQAVIKIEPDAAYYPSNCTGADTLTTYSYGTFDDGSGPVAEYQHNSNCSWLINVDDSVNYVTLNFIYFATEAVNDVVTVYDGPTTSSPVLGTFSGTTVPSAISSTGPQMLVTFVSNGTTAGQGFLAYYTTSLSTFCNSSGNFTAPEGDFTDGSGRFQYRNGQTCKWMIQPPDANSVTLEINSINTEDSKDVLEVYDFQTSQKIGSYSGTTIPAPVTAGSGKMLVMFKTNSTVRGEGFSASYSSITGIKEAEAVSHLTVYPNPAVDIININFTVDELQKVRIDLFSTSGISVLSQDLGSFRGNYDKQLNVSSLSKGIYNLRITSGQGISNKKIVVY